jgi:UDP-N-acetylmuramoyl-L-alanyl-D-glutamate--2,6-diaminopimelate ligase
MGEIAGRHAGLVVLTADNPKDEEPGEITDEIARGVARTPARCLRVLDRPAAIAAAVDAAASGSAVLVAGKGHETYQIVRGQFVPHSDAAVLAALGFRPLAARPDD